MLFRIDNESNLDPPIPERRSHDKRVAEIRILLHGLFEVLLHRDLPTEDRQFRTVRINSVRTKFTRDETLDSCFDRGVNEQLLFSGRLVAQGADGDVDTGEGGDERLLGGVVDFFDSLSLVGFDGSQ